MKIRLPGACTLALLAAFGLVVGCQPDQPSASTPEGQEHADAGHVHDDHSGWWCPEHGIPEHECSMCSATAAAACKAKGDWCEEHDRADSQCFICHPELIDVFAEKYRAKYGEDPPPIGEDLPAAPDSE